MITLPDNVRSFAWLAEDLATPDGTYAAGLRVVVMACTRRRATICLDPEGAHLGTRCHRQTVSRDALSGGAQ